MNTPRGVGVPLHQLLAQQNAAPRKDDGAPPPVETAQDEQQVQKEIRDVLQATHKSKEGDGGVPFDAQKVSAALARGDQVRLTSSALSVGKETTAIDPALAARITLLGPNRCVIADLARGLLSKRPTVLSAAAGSGAAFTARWYLEATKTKFSYARITRSTTLDSLVGMRRPDENNVLRMKPGPLNRCIQQGGVLVVDGLDLADEEVLGALKSLAKGAEYFHHPGIEPIKVHPNFRLVLITDAAKSAPADLLRDANISEIGAYTHDEMAELLKKQHGVPAQLADRLATFHEDVAAKAAAAELDYGIRFPISWSLLDKVGRRLKRDSSPEAVEDALMGIYGMRLPAGESRETFVDLVKKAGFADGNPRALRVRPETGFVDLPSQRTGLYHGLRALENGEALLFTARGQSGPTRMVEELARRRGQELCTIVGQAQSDATMLMEMPEFTRDGHLIFKPGRLTDALLSGKMIYVDHVDHMSPERQNAFYQLLKAGKIIVNEGGKLVERAISKKTALVLSATEGSHPTRYAASPEDRASVTEIRVDPPGIEDALLLMPEEVQKKPALAALVASTARELNAENPDLGITKLQRFIDFARTSALLAPLLGQASAVKKAAELVFQPPATMAVMKKLAKQAETEPTPPSGQGKKPLWMQLLRLKPEEIDRLLKGSGYQITKSMGPQLDALAIAFKLGRPVMVLGPASSGKTVLAALFARLVEKSYLRINLSDSTEPRDVRGGPGVKNVEGKTVVQHMPGPALTAAQVAGVLNVDEATLNSDILMLFKSMVDYRHLALDEEANREVALKSGFLVFTGNEIDAKTGRVEAPPTVGDAMFHIFAAAKPPEERVDILAKRSGLSRDLLTKTVNFYQELEVLVTDNPDIFQPAAAPYTFTERDMLKAAESAEHLIQRDGVKDPEAQRRILGREILRALRDLMFRPEAKEQVLQLMRAKKHFGDDIQLDARPTRAERVTIGGVEYLQVGVARWPIRKLGENPELDAKIPGPEGLNPPVGAQWDVIESLLLAMELKQPVALVGPTGSGKTMLATWLIRELNLPLWDQPCHADMRPEDFIGATIIDEKGMVRYDPAAILSAATFGGAAVCDEVQTASNGAREGINCVTERSEIQVLNKRPPEVLPYKDWSDQAAFIFTTNTRKDNFSDAEASRIRVIGVPELEERSDYLEIALRSAMPEVDYRPPKNNADSWKAILEGLLKIADRRTQFGKLLADAAQFSYGEGEKPELPETLPEAPKLDPKWVDTIADAFSLLAKRDDALRTLLDRLVAAQSPETIRAVGVRAKDALGPRSRELLEKQAVIETPAGKKLSDPEEAKQAAEMFFRLRELVKSSKTKGVSPLSPRIFGTFLELYTQLRSVTSKAEAATRAAHLSLWTKLPDAFEKKAVDLMVEIFGTPAAEQAPRPPQNAEKGIYFGDTFIPYGKRWWQGDASRFPLTPERCKNLELFAAAVAYGKGRPISCTDDANGETLEEIREFGMRTGRPVTVITLHPGIDLESLIEKFSRSDKDDAIKGFAPILQQIGTAVAEGHVLVIRGANNVPTNVLERLNSLGDGRMGLKLPRSRKWLHANPDFRMVLLKKPGAANQFGPALENRLLEPLLTTRDGGKADLRQRVGELAQIVRLRTNVSEQSSFRLALFHTYVNDVLAEHGFAGSMNVESFLNRDAEAVGRRLAFLKRRRGAVGDEPEMLHNLTRMVYGDRFDTPEDRELLEGIARACFGTPEDLQVNMSGELNRTPTLTRLGAWAVSRDPRPIRERVPGADEVLPRTETVSALEQKIFPALQFGEVIYLHGDETVASASVRDVSRLTNSPVFEVEATEKLSEAYLFGGLIQDPETGQLVEHEGVLWDAQKEKGTLFIKDASRLPPSIRTQLAEIAATGVLTRVKDGKLETTKPSFRLILQSESSYLQDDLAPLATRIRVPDIEDPKELETILGHTLLGVPGGAELAHMLRVFSEEAQKLVQDADLGGRQKLSFGTGRVFAAARELTEASRSPSFKLEEALADVLTRLYLAPARGLAAESKLRGRIEKLTGDLSTNLQAEAVQAIDFGERPQLADLDKDYRHAAAGLTRAAMQSAVAELTKVWEGRYDPARLGQIASALAGSDVVPEGVQKRAQKLANAVAGKSDQVVIDREARSLAALLAKESGSEEAPDFKNLLLEFLRGARLWDLEHRLGILDQYEKLLVQIEGPKGALVQEADAARERFDAAGSLERVEAMRKTVTEAIDAYSRVVGASSNQLDDLLQSLREKWNLVSTSPIFRDHDVLRNELAELQAIVDALKEAHADDPEMSAEVANLFSALKGASQTLLGLRIAEKGAELRRDLDRTAINASQLVDSLKREVLEIDRLQGAKRDYARLAELRQQVQEIASRNPFIHLRPDDQVERPDLRARDEIAYQAEQEAKSIVAREVVEAKRQAALRVQAVIDAQPAPDPEALFKDFDLERSGLIPAVPEGESAPLDPVAKAQSEVEAELSRYAAERFNYHKKRLVTELTNEDKERAADVYRERMRNRAYEIAARVQKTVGELERDLGRCEYSLDLLNTAPELHEELRALQADVAEASARARSWASTVENAFGAMESAALWAADMLTFNLLSFRKRKAAEEMPNLDLVPLQERAASFLEKLLANVESRMKALPDFAVIPDHVATKSDMEREMFTFATLGDMATRYAKIRDHQKNETSRTFLAYLRDLMEGITGPNDQELLQRVQAFTDSADILSSEIAGKRGLGLELEQAVDEVIKAAEAVRAQPLADGQFKSSTRALKLALTAVDSLGSPDSLPKELSIVRSEMAELLRLIGSGTETPLMVKTDAAQEELLKAIEAREASRAEEQEREQEIAASERTVTIKTSGDSAEVDPDRKRYGEALASSTAKTIYVDPRSPRSSEIKVVEIETSRMEDLAAPEKEGKAKKDDEVSAEVVAVQERARNAAGQLDALVRDSAGNLKALEKRTFDGLQALDDGLRSAALAKWKSELKAAAKALEEIIAGGGDTFRTTQTRVQQALNILRGAAKHLSAMETIDGKVGADLRAAVEGARPLGAAFYADSFDALANTWAADALLTVRQTEGVLNEQMAALESKERIDVNFDDVLKTLDKTAKKLGEGKDRIGAWSRFSLLANLYQRLEAGLDGLPNDGLKKKARAIIERAVTDGQALNELSGGRDGDQACADLHGAFMDLGAELAKTKSAKVPIEGYENLGELVWSILGPGPEGGMFPLLDRVQKTMSLLEALEKKTSGPALKASREMIATVATIRDAFLRKTLDQVGETWRSLSTDHLERVQSSLNAFTDSAKRFLGYNPLTEQQKTIAELAADLKGAIGEASTAATGPSVVLFSREILNLRTKLEPIAAKENELGRAAKTILEEIQHYVSGAEVMVKEEQAPARLAAMVGEVNKRIDGSHKGVVERKTVDWLKRVNEAFPELLGAPHETMAATLDRVEKDLFPELWEERQREKRRKEAEAKEAERRAQEAQKTPIESGLASIRNQAAAQKANGAASQARGANGASASSGYGSSGHGSSGYGSAYQAAPQAVFDPRPVASRLRPGDQVVARPGAVSIQDAELDFALGRATSALEIRRSAGAYDRRFGVGGGGGGLPGNNFNAPDPSDAPLEKGDGEGEAVLGRPRKLNLEGGLGELRRAPLLGGIRERSNSPELQIDATDLKSITKTLDEVVSEIRKRQEGTPTEGPELNAYQEHKADNAKRISKLGQILRTFPDTEVLCMVDQSGSTATQLPDLQGHVREDSPTILDLERAAVGLVMGAVQAGEGNLAVLGFGQGPNSWGWEQIGRGRAVAKVGEVSFYAHKSMADPLDDETGNAVFELLDTSSGGTEIDAALDVAARPQMFSSNVNNKMVLLFTDAQVNNPREVYNKIESLRQKGYAVAVVCFGDETHAEAIAGEFGITIGSSKNPMDELLEKLPGLVERCLIEHHGRKLGAISASAQGIGVSDSQMPLIAAEPGALDNVPDLTTPVPDQPDGGQVVVSAGARREQRNLVDRTKYLAACRMLAQKHAEQRKSSDFNHALAEVRALSARQQRSGVGQTLREAFAHGLPRARGSEWEKKQFSGPHFDEDQLPLYIVGLAQGAPELRLFKRRKPAGKLQFDVLFKVDTSTSTGRRETRQAQIEAVLAQADAIKANFPQARIGVISDSDKVRLHHAFDMEWDDNAKAHLYMSLNASQPATDDERGSLESIGLLDLQGSEVGLVISVTDGQGMPGTPAVVNMAAERGYGFLNIGIGPESKSVLRFGDHGLYARNLNMMSHKLWASLVKVWEKAGRVVQ